MNDWKEEIINEKSYLEKLIKLNDDEIIGLNNSKYKWAVTKHIVSLMDKNDHKCPIRRQFIPSLKENVSKGDDYLTHKENRVDTSIPDCIARQYNDRIAFLVSNVCSSYCRYCFRKEAILDNELRLSLNINQGISWISKHPEIRDILITGGDPLMLSNSNIKYIVSELEKIKHIEIIRIGTRMPITLPKRIDEEFLSIFPGRHRKPVWINIQCNHPKEITEELKIIVYELMRCGVNVGNQAVLLKGINDNIVTLRKLHQKLLSIRVRPYYLFQCEEAPGNKHFIVPIENGCDLMDKSLLKHTTGMARPHYVLATNKGKIPCKDLIS
jgi:lysine 2,3-aminomutase